MNNWSELARRLSGSLNLANAPLAITFHDAPPDGVKPCGLPIPSPLADGRTGRAAAGCVFWIHGETNTFSTVEQDHGNCSVGSMTHGFKTLDEVAGNDDVAALVGSGWVTMELVPHIPVITKKPGSVTYGPLADTSFDPDVVFIRVNGKQLMVLSDAIPGLRIEGKPQCHIVAIAKEQREIAASVGCALSRVRTGMPATEMTCAIPAEKLGAAIEAIEKNAIADAAVSRYASEDATRFA
ncbi:MAG: hypothetical protein EXQ69_01565 [Acidimicrobiia bacterium]|nr:hypothetical protein [Acidimicrobiia bacterium]